MNKITIDAYHTCSNKNGESFILNNSPFLCKQRKGQWLGIGYYFWPDSDHFAHEWGKFGYKDNYAIVKCEICFPYEEMFDLCGNVKHNLEFENYYERMCRMLEMQLKKYPNNKKLQIIYNNGNISISEVFWFLREKCKNEFKYLLIKVSDRSVKQTIKFVNNCNRQETIGLLPRVQMVVYPEASEYISNKELHYCTTV